MIVYISGPMTGKPELNFPAFNAAAAHLRGLGYGVKNPTELDADDAHALTWEQYMRRDLTELLQCEAIYLLRGWEKSRGARAEQFVAATIGLLHLYENAEAA